MRCTCASSVDWAQATRPFETRIHTESGMARRVPGQQNPGNYSQPVTISNKSGMYLCAKTGCVLQCVGNWKREFTPRVGWPAGVQCQRQETPPGFGCPRKFHAKWGGQGLRPQPPLLFSSRLGGGWLRNFLGEICGGGRGARSGRGRLRPKIPGPQNFTKTRTLSQFPTVHVSGVRAQAVCPENDILCHSVCLAVCGCVHVCVTVSVLSEKRREKLSPCHNQQTT